jgi:DNA-binding transcriptional MerR regulator
MRIGELARRTGVATRMIRYYEHQGLLRADREANGYRDYAESDVDRVARIADLVQSGIATRLVKVLLDAEDARARDEPSCPIEVARQLAREVEALDRRIACLSRSRDSVSEFLDRACSEVDPLRRRSPRSPSTRVTPTPPRAPGRAGLPLS